MLRRRRPLQKPFGSNEDEFSYKNHAKDKKTSCAGARVLASTLSAAVWAALKPSQDVRSQAYSAYLTSQVQGLTIGWHLFRSITEGAFLATYGLAFNTLVVQVFCSISVFSVLLYCLRRETWLRWRERICIGANFTYGIVTVLKIFSLLDRLPNENHYMFKHCFLTMADAAFSQTAVHKQYVVQFAEAVIRIIVWRRYNVLADTPTWAVIAVSLAWQIWLVTFSSMLQARHVDAFRRQYAAAAAAATSATATAGSSSSSTAKATAGASGGPVPQHASSDEVGVAPARDAASAAAAATSSAPTIATAAAAAGPGSAPDSTVAKSASPAGAGAAADGGLGICFIAATAASGSGHGAAAGKPSAAEPLHAGLSTGSGSSALTATSQKRFMRALRTVARGPSSYVLLSHQRRQAGAPLSASVQFYIPGASPDMLPASGHWRERLASTISEGAPGWQVVNLCVRKGSLIVHLDLVYLSNSPRAATGGAAASSHAALGSGPACGGGCFPAAAYSEQPYDFSAAGSSAGSCNPQAILDECLGGMGADSLLELLGLSPEPPTLAPISVQIGDKLRNLSPAIDPAAMPVTPSTIKPTSFEPTVETTATASASTSVLSSAASSAASVSISAAWLDALRWLVMMPLQVALFPPASLRSPEYAVFLSSRVGALNLAYATFLCVTAAAMLPLHGVRALNPVTMALFMSAELLSVAAHLLLGRRRGGETTWRRARCNLVYMGVCLRTLQMLACTSGVLPHVLRDSDCASGRWIQKVLLITTLQALCMQPPVRSFFLVRLPSVLLSIYVHVFVCRTHTALASVVVLHLGWEALLFTISANLQLRHLEAFRRRQGRQCDGALFHGGHKRADQACTPTAGGDADVDVDVPAGRGAAADEREPLLLSQTAPSSDVAGGSGPDDVPPANRAAAAAGRASSDHTAIETYTGTGRGKGTAFTADGLVYADPLAPPTPPGDDGGAAAVLGPAADAAAGPQGFVPAGAVGDPYDVSLSGSLVAMLPRRAGRLELHFTCAPAVVDELQVVLRHINPAAMSSGVHAAHAVRDISRALVAPAGIELATCPAAFSAELTMVASPADMPGLVHVELWRGRRRVGSHPVLLAAAPEPPLPIGDLDGSAACAAPVGVSGAEGASAEGSWLNDVCAYVRGLQGQGHSAAADQFVEELGTWMAQAAAVERGLTAASSGGGATAGAVANVLYFHGYGSDFMYVKPRRVSGSDRRGSSSGGGAAGAAAASDPLQGTLRQLLVVQGSMMLAVAVEAGCVALSQQLVGVMVGQLGANLGELLEGARTPVTQLPLLHAAVKSGDTRMVDLVAEWSSSCGLKDIWATEAAILAVSLEACASSASGSPASLHHTTIVSGFGGGHDLAATSGAAAPAAAVKRSWHPLLQDPPSPVSAAAAAALRTAERRPSGGGLAAPAVAAAVGHCLDTATNSSASLGVDMPDAGADPDPDPELFSTGDRDISELSPFKIIDFRASSRGAGGGSGGVASGPYIHGQACEVGFSGGSGGPTASGGHRGRSVGFSGLAAGRSSVDGLMDGGVLVLTPLHMSLALGDEGRLASHILRTYPEAYGLWCMSQQQFSADLYHDSANNAIIVAANPGCERLECSGGGSFSLAAQPPLAASGSFTSSGAALAMHVAAATPVFRSLPGLAAARAGGNGCGAGGCDDSISMSSMQSASLSEVAFFEGIRWLDAETHAKRPSWNVARVDA